MPDAATNSGTSQPVRIGSYQLVEPLGSGGMSSVFRAVHLETGHEVALKVLTRTLAKNSTLLQRFLREAKSAETLQHPNIVAIYDRGSEDGRYYLVLEYVAGGDLHDRVRSQGPLSAAEAVRVIRGCAEGLRYAAAKGVIHRDIKPANILLTREGEPKLADLGLALQIEDEDERVTRDGTTVGTVDYMSPEQARDSRAISIRSDMYSLGCTFYHLLAGAAPFAGGDVPEKLRRHAQEPPPDVRRVRADVPPAVAKLIQRMMAKKPDARFKDYDELIATIDALPPLPTTVEGDPLYALFDDDGDAPLPVPAMDLGSHPVPSGSTAEMRPGSAGRSGSQLQAALNLDLVELAALEDEPASSRVPPKPKSLASTPSTPAPPASSPHPTALFDDEGDGPPSAPGMDPGSRPVPSGSAGRSGSQLQPAANLDLVELAALDDEPASSRVPAKPKPPSASPSTTTPPASSPHPTALFDDDEDKLSEESADDDLYGPGPAGMPRRSAYDDDAMRQWIIRGLLIGAAVVLVAIGIDQLWRLQRSYNTGGPVIPSAGSDTYQDDFDGYDAPPSAPAQGGSSF